MSERRVWVGCLACYNAGTLVGDWLSPQDGPEWECWEHPSDHKETWVFDHEGWEGWLTGECSPAEAAHLDEILTDVEHSSADLAAVAAWAGNTGEKLAEVDMSDFWESFAGAYESEEDFAYSLIDDLDMFTVQFGVAGNVKLHDDHPLVRYFDYDAFARDLFMGDYWSTPYDLPGGRGVYVFRST